MTDRILNIRPATINDAKTLFEWANDPEVRNNAHNKDQIAWEDHVKWFDKKLSDQDCYIYILEMDGVSCAQIRFDFVDKDETIIDYSVDKNYRRKGLMHVLLKLSINEIFIIHGEQIRIIAEVLEHNIGSSKALETFGFRLDEQKSTDEIKVFNYRKSYGNYIILSSKSWNKKILNNLESSFPAFTWHQIGKKEDFTVEKIEKINPLKIYVPHWSYIIPAEIYENYDCVVFHMTDLPFGRGGSPLQNLISRGHKETKITAIKVVKELDAGPIYLKKPLTLYGTAEEIFLRANDIILEMISEITKYNPRAIEQTGEATLFKRRTKDMSDINKVEELSQLYDHIRMLDAEGYPKAFFENSNFRFEFTRASLKSDDTILADVRIFKK